MLKKSMALALILSSTSLLAEEATTSTTKVKVKKEQKVDKADELITNRKMRAENGSLSSYSVSTSFNYSGGSLNKPFAADRPNIAAAGDVVSLASMSGDISLSYRINKKNRLGLGAGLSMVAPFNNSIDTNNQRAKSQFDKNQGKLDISNPYLSYSNINKFFGVQTVFSGSLTQITSSSMNDAGYINSVDVSVNSMYDFGGSPLSVGLLIAAGKYVFDDTAIAKEDQTDTVIGFYPQAEYNINDTYNLRTIIRSNVYENTRADLSDYSQHLITQSVGLGISMSRDVFLYPNIQFAYQNFQASNTNIGISANINMF